jgi:hypothetical protein
MTGSTMASRTFPRGLWSRKLGWILSPIPQAGA